MSGNTGIVLNYTDLNGDVLLPTPEEVHPRKPNVLSWRTPIDNGAFYTALHLDALCTKWELAKDSKTRKEAAFLAKGLLLLATVGDSPGFIARGVTGGSKTHYAAGGNDQSFPW